MSNKSHAQRVYGHAPRRCRPLRGLALLSTVFRGFRYAPPQVLCCHLLRRLKKSALQNLVSSFFKLLILPPITSLVSLSGFEKPQAKRQTAPAPTKLFLREGWTIQSS